ncbi:tyrosinase [Gymnopus androsaceus JB14]|uniref:tyrosinase n=1 Tax=Gymnopus androsaceus JB14 TaxID=1447944 RepID=A0A6A4HP64_9AGAR|nr:tyrosinase [Gymnopus androsaceus JB14]
MSHYLVTGATGGSTSGAGAPNRLEINVFVKQEDQFSLYIQALQLISGKSQSEIDSFFQIGGIHGLPYVPWDGAGSKPVDPDAWEGYCTHGSVLFPTFHRPYVLLVEQAIQAAAVNIAATYTVDKARYQQAALNLRQPYWDWALKPVPPPEVISLDEVTIVNPSGQKVSVANPLRRYTFHPIDPSFPDPYASWPTTLRYPTSDDASASEDISQLTRTLENAQLRTKTYNLLTRVHTWPAFSNHTVGDGGSASNSLEGIHDSVHVDVGGNGHMSDPSVAAFDPIFFMHHAQVDRLLSLWSALNPGVWITNGPSGDGTWTIPADTEVGKNTNLAPFWKTQTQYWTSANVTSTQGYTYPEFNNLNMGDTAAVKAAIAKQVNQLYGGTSSIFSSFAATAGQSLSSESISKITTTPTTAPTTSGTAKVSSDKDIQAQSNDGAPQVMLASVGPGNSQDSKELWEWTARVQIKKHEVGGSFKVLFFLGNIPNDPREWSTAESFVGAFHGFVNTSAERCANCRRQQDVVLEGFVHLNDGIAKISNLNTFDPAVVEPYLTSNLHWRVQKVSTEVVDLSAVPSLQVTVTSTRLTLPPGAPFPVPGETQHHHGITHGRPGGSRQDTSSESA